jgi:hypothetical protein
MCMQDICRTETKELTHNVRGASLFAISRRILRDVSSSFLRSQATSTGTRAINSAFAIMLRTVSGDITAKAADGLGQPREDVKCRA